MSFTAMSVLMLAIALGTGLTENTLESLSLSRKRYFVFAFLVLAAVMRAAEIRISPECVLNAGCLFAQTALCILAALRLGKKVLRTLPVIIPLGAVSAFLFIHIGGDAAFLAASVLPLAVYAAARSVPDTLFTCGLIPAFSALTRLITGVAADGYGVFELDAGCLDLVMLSVLVSITAAELRCYGRSVQRRSARSYTDPGISR